MESLGELVRGARGRRSKGELVGEAFETCSLVILYFATGWSELATLDQVPRI